MRIPSLFLSAFSAGALLAASAAHAVPNNGGGSGDRSAECSRKLGDCLAAADETCHFSYGGNAQQLQACLDERRGACEHSYGSNSGCASAAARSGVDKFRNGTLKPKKN
jgi:hypothetical protein